MKRLLAPAIVLALASDCLAQWAYMERKDGFTDEDTSLAVPRSPEPYLVVSCARDKLTVALAPGEYIGTENPRVRYRFDSDEASDYSEWYAPMGDTIAFAPTEPEDFEPIFVDLLVKKSELLYEIISGDGKSFKRTVDLTGSGEAIKQLICYEQYIDYW